MLRPSVFLAQGIAPHLIPAGLVAIIPPFQAGDNCGHQRPALPATAIVVLAEMVVGVLAGDRAYGPPLKKDEALPGFQRRPIGDIHQDAANT